MIPFNETTSEKHIDARLTVTYDIDIEENKENLNKILKKTHCCCI